MLMNFLHASCVSLESRAILIQGPSGAGKSDLAIRLIDAGATLIADDYVDIQKIEGHLVASPPESIAGKIEVRGVGLVQMPFESNVDIALMVHLTPRKEIQRLPESNLIDVEGVSIPFIQLDPHDSSAAAK